MNLYPLLNETQKIAIKLREQAAVHNNTKSGRFLESLNHLSFERFRIIKSKFDTVRFFFSDPKGDKALAEENLKFEFTQDPLADRDKENNEFADAHEEWANGRLALSSLLRKMQQDLQSTTPDPSNLEPTPETRKRRHFQDQDPLKEEIDPTGYIPRFEQFNEKHLNSRHPRQIFGFLASMMVSLGVSSAFGIVNGQKIEHLSEALSDVVDRQDLLLAQVDANSKEIQTNRHMLSNLGDITRILGSMVREEQWMIQGMYLYMIIETELAKLDSLLDTYINAMSAAQQNHLHIGILTEEGVNEVFELMKQIGSENNLVPIINSAVQISQLPVSWALASEGCKIIIHALASNEKKTFKLMEYSSFPINIGRAENGSPAAFGRIIPKNSILAIGSDHRYIELTPYELSLCSSLGNIKLCSEHIFNKPERESCLSSLFQADHTKSVSLCSLALESADQDQVIETAPNTFRYFSIKGSNSFRTVCPSSNTIGQLTMFTNLNVPQNCYLDTPGFYLYRRDTLSTTFDPLPSVYEWNLPILEFFEDDMEIKDLTEGIKKLEKWKGIPAIDSSTIQKLHKMQRPFYHEPPLLSALTISTVALIAVSILIFAICYQAYKHHRQQKRNLDPTYRYKELLKDEGNIDALIQFIQQHRDQDG